MVNYECERTHQGNCPEMNFRDVRRLIIIILLIAIVPVFSLNALGQRERGIRNAQQQIEEAKELIEGKRYNDALLIIEDVIEKYPELQQDATVLLRKIWKIQDQYQDLVEEFKNVIENEPDNLEKALGLIDELHELDENPNKTIRQRLEQFRIIALLRYNENIFNEIMADAALAIQEERYQEAISIYQTGFSLHRDEFLDLDYGLLSTGISAEIRDIRESTETLITDLKPFLIQKDNFINELIMVNPENTDNLINGFKPNYDDKTESFFTLRAAAQNLQEYRTDINRIIENPSPLALRHIEYMELLTLGSDRTGESEGISGVLKIILAQTLEESGNLTMQRWRENYESAQNAFAETRYQNAKTLYEKSNLLQLSAMDVLELREKMIKLSSGFTIQYGKELALKSLPLYMETKIAWEVTIMKSLLSDEIVDFQNRYNAETEGITDLTTDQEYFRNARNRFLDYLSNWQNTVTEYSEIDDTYTDREKISDLEETAAVLNDWALLAENKEISITSKLAELKYQPLFVTYDSINVTFEQGQRYMEGIIQEISTGTGSSFEITSVYPDRARDIYTTVINDLRSLRNTVTNYIAEFEAEPEYLVMSDPVSLWITRAKGLLADINNLLNTATERRRESLNQITLAEELRESGFDTLAKAQNAYEEITTVEDTNFDRARTLIEDANDFFYKSVATQEDIAFRKEYDGLIQELEKEIKKKRHELILARVGEMVEEGRQFYLQNEFPRAEQILLDAENLWDRTNPIDPHPQVEQWLNLTQIALNQEQAREIAETHPSYPSVMTLLNYARENFESGQNLMDKGNQKEANQLLNSARNKLLTVTTEFPFNKEAGVLTLKIIEILNPDNFDNLFDQRIEEARINLAQNPEEAYYDLLDLKEIKPNYPGIDDLIYQAEIATGRRLRPPDQAELRRAEQLYQEALEIYEERDTARYQTAIANLNEALDINPNFQAAATLWDQIQLDRGGEIRFTLPSAAFEKYQLALEYFLNGNYALSFREVSLLLQNEENRGFEPLMDLNARLQRELGGSTSN